MRALCLVAVSLLTTLGCANRDPNTFRNVTVGFEVTKPAGWQFISADQNLENMKRTSLDDKELHAAMVKYATTPLVVMLKYPEPFDDVNPSFKVNVRPLGQLKGAPPVDIVKLLIPQLEKTFKDFEVVEQPSTTLVSKLPAGHMRIHYSLQVPDGRSFPTSSEIWVIPRGNFFFMIGGGTRQDEATGSRNEIQSILQTVRIVEGDA